MYKVLLEHGAEKDLDALDDSLRKRIVERLLLLKTNPRPNGSRKLSASVNAWRLRVGDYRIVYEISNKTKEIKVYRIKHRAEVYK